jgi:hypothetical protein
MVVVRPGVVVGGFVEVVTTSKIMGTVPVMSLGSIIGPDVSAGVAVVVVVVGAGVVLNEGVGAKVVVVGGGDDELVFSAGEDARNGLILDMYAWRSSRLGLG